MYVIIAKFRERGYTYNSPTQYIYAESQKQATDIAKNHALARFPQWTFHVAQCHTKYNKK